MLLTNRYRVIQTLGSGGFGETFLAEDTQMPSRRRCVVKLLKPITNNPQIYEIVQERFGREAAILEELGGKNEQIPSLYAYFELEGQFYLVQEWVEGVTLTKLFRDQGVLDEDQVREMLVQILPVLEYVHQQRIVHRDIKPDNIILRKHDGKPVLIDFGAVRESMGTVVNSQGNPTSSIVIGTPGYMPSEQAAGRPIYSSDLYSLGMTVIYLLTGKVPQELETDPQTGEIIWRQFAPHLSAEFAEIIDQSIAYHPRERFTSAQAMLDALQSSIPQVAPTQYVVHQNHQNQDRNVNQNIVRETASNQNSVDTKYAGTVAAESINNSVSIPANSNQMLKKGLIAGGLIAASLFIGIAIARNNSSPSSTTISTNSTPSNSNNDTSPADSFQAGDTTQDENYNSNSNSQLEANSANNSNQPDNLINSPNSIIESEPSPLSTTSTNPDYSWLSQRLVTQSDLVGKDAFTLDIMRNSIYARRGFRFQTPGLQAYFNQQPWYQPIYPPANQMDSAKILSQLEMENAVRIRNYQKANNLFHF